MPNDLIKITSAAVEFSLVQSVMDESQSFNSISAGRSKNIAPDLD